MSKEYPGDSESASDDDVDDAEFLANMQKAAASKSNAPRQSILAERWEKDAAWKAPVHSKTEEQRLQIRAACTRSFMFAALPDDLLATVLDAFYGPQVLPPGTEVITQGASVTSGEPGLYIIESGTLDVHKNGQKVFQYDKQGQSFGELALLYSCPRAATVTATSTSVVYSIDRDTFNNCVKGAVQEMHTRRESFLRSVAILADLNDDHRMKIADVLQTRICEAGETIITQGDMGSTFFIVEEGWAYAEVAGIGRTKDYKPGDYFGELALIRQQPRAATVISGASRTKLAILDSESFNRLLGKQVTDRMHEIAKTYEGPAGAGAH